MATAGFIFSLFLAFVTFWAWPRLDGDQAEMASQQQTQPGPTQTVHLDADPVDRDPAQRPEKQSKENP